MDTPELPTLPALTAELLARYDIAGPRYTSYPTADRFHDGFGAEQYQQALEDWRASDAAAKDNLSVYVHIPFCQQLCYFCACNKIITRHSERGTAYLPWLQRELDLYAPYLPPGQMLRQLHLGGGSPTFLSDDDLSTLMHMLGERFTLASDGEHSVEVDPRTVDSARVQHLAALGFNRISFGVQDFDPQVQQAINRVQSTRQVFSLVAAARAAGFASVNIDLIYGLPRQTAASFAHTLEQVCTLRPDRIALYAYAHLPERFKAQRRIGDHALPAAADKLQMLAQALQAFTQAGYSYVGMDHFALPSDSLAQAKRAGKLQRNFQGYSTQPDGDLIGLGVSAIGRMGTCYSQNAKTLEEYEARIAQGQFATARGVLLSRDDVMRRAVITTIMCQGTLDFAAFEAQWGVAFAGYFAAEMQQLPALEAQGMLTHNAHGLRLTGMGWYFVRAVAMVFDRYLASSKAQFSKIL